MLRITNSVGASDLETLARSVESMSLQGRVPSLRAQVDLARHFPSLLRFLFLSFPFLLFV